MKIYTKTGDQGHTGLYSGARLSKADPVFACLGDLDELNAALGMAMSTPCEAPIKSQVRIIQGWLIEAGSCVATPDDSGSSRAKVQRTRFDDVRVARLEAWIDDLDKRLPKLTRFILPSGGQAASALHFARSVCRRAERALVALDGRDEELAGVLMFLNRTSDFLFMAARAAATDPEIEYRREA